MLVLSRRQNEVIRIGADGGIRITVVEVGDGTVRLGVDAPAEIPVHREEVFQSIRRERGEQ